MNDEMLTKSHLERLLYAVSNVGGDADPETAEGIIYSEAALTMASKLFPKEQEIREQMHQSGYGLIPELRDFFNPQTVDMDWVAVKQGFILAVELWLECMKAEYPCDYAEGEIVKGLNGERVV